MNVLVFYIMAFCTYNSLYSKYFCHYCSMQLGEGTDTYFLSQIYRAKERRNHNYPGGCCCCGEVLTAVPSHSFLEGRGTFIMTKETKKKLISEAVAIAVGLGIALIPAPGGLEQKAMWTMGLLIWAIINWMTNAIPDFVCIFIMCCTWGSLRNCAVYDGIWKFLGNHGLAAHRGHGNRGRRNEERTAGKSRALDHARLPADL